MLIEGFNDSNNLVSKKTALCIDPVPRKMQNATAMNGGGRWTVELNGSARAGTILSAVPLSLYYFYITTWGFMYLVQLGTYKHTYIMVGLSGLPSRRLCISTWFRNNSTYYSYACTSSPRHEISVERTEMHMHICGPLMHVRCIYGAWIYLYVHMYSCSVYSCTVYVLMWL